MSEETWHGIPRNEILWHPTIDYKKCVSCGKCVEYCPRDVFESEEKEGKKKSVVKNPNSCVVFCTGCDGICPADAITHPSKKNTQETIKTLRKTYDLQNEKRVRIGEHRK